MYFLIIYVYTCPINLWANTIWTLFMCFYNRSVFVLSYMYFGYNLCILTIILVFSLSFTCFGYHLCISIIIYVFLLSFMYLYYYWCISITIYVFLLSFMYFYDDSCNFLILHVFFFCLCIYLSNHPRSVHHFKNCCKWRGNERVYQRA